MRPARFYVPMTLALLVAASVNQYMAEPEHLARTGFTIAFTCIWPVVFYLAATNTVTPWVNNVILGMLFVGLTPSVFDNTTSGWAEYPLTALIIGAIVTSLMAVTLLYSILLSLRLKAESDREETS